MTEDIEEQVQQLVKRGEQFLTFGELEAAKESFMEAIKIDGNNARALHRLGIIHRDGKDIEKAREYLKDAIKANPEWLKPLETLGVLEFSLDNDRDAVKHLKKYMNKDGDDVEILDTLARAAFAIEDCKTVISVTAKIIEMDDTRSQVWVMRGICQARLDRFNAACTSLNVAVELNPGSVSSLNTVGELSFNAKNYQAAIEIYSLSYEKNHDQPQVLFHLGLSHWFVEHWAKAIPYFERYVQLVPEDPKGWNNLGVALREKGEVKRAMECYSNALELDTSLEVVRKNMSTAKHMEMVY